MDRSTIFALSKSSILWIHLFSSHNPLSLEAGTIATVQRGISQLDASTDF